MAPLHEQHERPRSPATMQRTLDEAGWTFFKGVLALTPGCQPSRLFGAVQTDPLPCRALRAFDREAHCLWAAGKRRPRPYTVPRQIITQLLRDLKRAKTIADTPTDTEFG